MFALAVEKNSLSSYLIRVLKKNQQQNLFACFYVNANFKAQTAGLFNCCFYPAFYIT
jgi:hypothetical protein